jgi:hypothetical protein
MQNAKHKYIILKSDIEIDRSGANGYLFPNTVHTVIGTTKTSVGLKCYLVLGVGNALVKVFEDEAEIYKGTVNQEILEKSKKLFEKSQQESNNSIKFVSSVNNTLKKEQMKKVELSPLTKTEMATMEAIYSNPKDKKKKAVKSTDKAMIGVEADLSVVDSALDGYDGAKICRKMHRADLISYKWLEDGSKERVVAVTEKGFEAIQLGVKVPKPKTEKAPKEAKAPKAEKAVKAKPAKATKAKVEEDILGEQSQEEQTGFEVKSNPVAKTFNITFEDGSRFRLKVKTAQEFKDCKDNSLEEWETLRDLGELEELED